MGSGLSSLRKNRRQVILNDRVIDNATNEKENVTMQDYCSSNDWPRDFVQNPAGEQSTTTNCEMKDLPKESCKKDIQTNDEPPLESNQQCTSKTTVMTDSFNDSISAQVNISHKSIEAVTDVSSMSNNEKDTTTNNVSIASEQGSKSNLFKDDSEISLKEPNISSEDLIINEGNLVDTIGQIDGNVELNDFNSNKDSLLELNDEQDSKPESYVLDLKDLSLRSDDSERLSPKPVTPVLSVRSISKLEDLYALKNFLKEQKEMGHYSDLSLLSKRQSEIYKYYCKQLHRGLTIEESVLIYENLEDGNTPLSPKRLDFLEQTHTYDASFTQETDDEILYVRTLIRLKQRHRIPELKEHLNEFRVLLLETTLNGDQLEGVVAAKDCRELDVVRVRYTYNNWNSFFNESTHCISRDGDISYFEFTCIHELTHGCNLELVICFTQNGIEHWDNNDGHNYSFSYVRRPVNVDSRD